MHVYTYVARSGASRQRVSGTISAESREEALRQLLGRRVLSVVSLHESVSVPLVTRYFWSRVAHWYWGLQLRPARLTFFRSMAQFVRHGISLTRGLGRSMTSCPNPRFREALRSVLVDVTEGGMTFSDALSRRPDEFTVIQTAMIRAGEGGANFELVIARIASLEERARRVGNKVQRALYYPAFVLLAVISLLAYLVTVFVPQFATLATALGQQVPWQTQMLTQVGSIFTNPISLTVLIGGIWASVVAVRAYLATSTGRMSLERFVLQLPYFGLLRTKAVTASFARLTGSMLFAGVPFDRAFDLVQEAVGSPVFARGIAEMRVDVRVNGTTFADACAKTALFDPTFVELVSAGEEAESIPTMLEKIADDYDDDVETALSSLSTVLEPALIGVLGIGVFAILAAVYGPLYGMIAHIR